MRNLRKLLAVVLAVTVVLSVMATAAFADTAISADATTCKTLGMLVGPDANGVTADYTASQPSRAQAAMMLLRLKGLDKDALAFTGTDNFSDVTNAYWKPVTAYLKAHQELGFAGVGDNKFDLDSKITAQQFYKVVLTGLGYKVKADANDTTGDFLYSDTITFAASKGLTKVATASPFTVDNLATATVEGLKATVKGGTKTLAQTLGDANADFKAKATTAGLIVAAPAAAALDVKGAVAITSKIVEVSLNAAATAADVAAAQFSVKDSAAKALNVTKSELAAYDTKGKTVLVTLDADTTAGTAYTLTLGSKSVNFGGIAADTSKPTISKIESTEFNKVKITFSEPVKFDGASISIAEKYGNKAALAVSATSYGANTEIVLTTADQKAATLYGVTVSGVTDFSGNVMDKDDAKTFVGNAKKTDAIKVSTAYGQNNPEEAVVRFSERVDATTISKDAFKVEELYGTKAVLPVTDARIATTDDLGINGATLADKLDDANGNDTACHVILTIPSVKDATLYKVTVTGVKSVYGTSLSTTSTDTYTTFVGKKKPTDPYTYSINTGAAISSTRVDVKFSSKPVEADAENVANYAIAEAYGSKAALAVTKAELQSDGYTVKLTTAAMSTVLYKMTITNIKDIYGNSVKTASDANIVSYSGRGSASKISKINTIAYDGTSVTQIVVTFDQNVGASATDVTHYTVDNSVGYVQRAETVSANAAQVKLTLPKLTTGKSYTLTVKGLENADGVAMDTAGVSGSFLGKGNDATKPEITAVIATDKQTLKIYFDRDVTDSAINGVLWTNTSAGSAVNTLSGVNHMTIKGASSFNTTGTKDLDAYTEYAYQDSADKNVLVVRVDSADFVSTNAQSDGTFVLDASACGKLDADHDTVAFAPSSTSVASINIDSVLAINAQKIRVYFDQAVEIPTVANFAKIAKTTAARDTLKSNFSPAPSTDILTLSNPVAIDSSKKIYDFAVSAALASGSNYLVVNTAVSTAAVHEYTANASLGYVTIKDEDTSASAAGVQMVREFAGSTTSLGVIDSLPVVMTDARTIEVYYPMAMDTSVSGTDAATSTSVKDFDNYVIKDGASTPATIVTGAAAFNDISWDSTAYKATIKLNADLPASSTGYFMYFSNTMADATGLTKVEKTSTAHEQINTQFAASTATSAKITITSATYNATAHTLTIKLSQKAKTDSNLVGVSVTQATYLAARFNINAIVSGATDVATSGDISSIAADLGGTSVADTTAGWFDELVITLNPAYSGTFDASGVANVTFVDSAAGGTGTGLTAVNGMHGDKDSKALFGQN